MSRATHKEFGDEKIEEPETATSWLRMRMQNPAGTSSRILRDRMVELGRRRRSYTPSIEVIDECSEDDRHQGQGLSGLAEVEQAKQAPHSTYRAGTACRKTATYSHCYIERCRIPPQLLHVVGQNVCEPRTGLFHAWR